MVSHTDVPVADSDLRSRQRKSSSAGTPTEESLTKLPSPQLSLALLWGASLLVGWSPLVDTFKLAVRDYEYTHLLLILPVSAALILLDWRSLRPILSRNVRGGFVLLAVAILIAGSVSAWSTSLPSDAQLSIRMFALVLSWIGAFVLCFGSSVSRAVLFPLCFLFALVPFPHFVLNEIVGFLQSGSTLAAHGLFATFGVPVSQNGFLLTIPGLTVEVAKECSSIRSSSMLLVTAMVLAQLVLRSPWRRGLVIAIAIPLSVAKNGLRIFTIAMLGSRVNPSYLTGKLHHDGGIVFFAVALGAVFGLIWILRRRDAPTLI